MIWIGLLPTVPKIRVPNIHRLVAKLTAWGHTVYFALVSIEAHGYYRFAAGGLFVAVLVELVSEGHEPGA